MSATLSYAAFEALYTRGIIPPKGTRFEQPIAYQIAHAASAPHDAEYERRVLELGRAGRALAAQYGCGKAAAQ